MRASSTYGGDNSVYSAHRLFDLSVTEDTCVDYWLLPDRSLGTVAIDFHKTELISRLMLLNTRNSGYLDRAARDIEVVLFKDEEAVIRKVVSMRPHPAWTEIDLGASLPASRLELRVLSFEGTGGGLNEVQIFRSDSRLGRTER